ncbi:hypothetical protein OsccyDRAFT_3790 [Leptolyngbyaceae cyanobacterium JSC-12]|nr:hypothetical protein OsccyDRAFT_3790 [Leptolyngbyaceae cyanobacterium JSC-12]
MSARRLPPPVVPLVTKWLLVASKSSQPSRVAGSSEAGLSLIECLVAILVIAVTVVAITPPVFLATASRIQARRADQANQIAQAEVDRIRGIVERGAYVEAALPPIGNATSVKDTTAATSVNTTLLLSPGTCTVGRYPPVLASPPPATSPLGSNQLIPVDIDGDCQAEYAMQVFRTQGCVPANKPADTPPYSFSVGVRVYSYNPQDGATVPTLGTERANLAMTTGRRDKGTEFRRPLQVVYSRASRNTNADSFQCVARDQSPPAPTPSPSPSP